MGAEGDVTERPALRPEQVDGWATPWVVVRTAVVVMVLGVLALVVLMGARASPLHALERALRTGQVHEATVYGPLLPEGATGCVTQQVVWRGQGLHRRTEVRATRGTDGGCLGARPRPPVTDADVLVQRLAPGVVVHRVPDRSGPQLAVAGWGLPDWLRVPAVLSLLAVLVLLVSTPSPWRATRWAWFWLFGSPVAVVLFLLFGGPLVGLPRARLGHRRLTGGWSFLLAVLVVPATTWLSS
ncbi:hypothetical protein GCM10027446_26020 [Angustibacter peucedani]